MIWGLKCVSGMCMYISITCSADHADNGEQQCAPHGQLHSLKATPRATRWGHDNRAAAGANTKPSAKDYDTAVLHSTEIWPGKTFSPTRRWFVFLASFISVELATSTCSPGCEPLALLLRSIVRVLPYRMQGADVWLKCIRLVYCTGWSVTVGLYRLSVHTVLATEIRPPGRCVHFLAASIS